MATNGDAIARDPAGRVVFVKGALPGERVRVQIVAEHPKSASGSITELLEASPHRITPPCPEVARGCGGCPWQHVSIDGQRQMKHDLILNAIRFAGIEPPAPRPTVELAAWGYRTTVRAGVKDGRAGLRGTRSHDLVDVDTCAVAHPLLAELLVGRRYAGADEVLLRCGAGTGERLVFPTPSHVGMLVPDDVSREHIHELAAGRLWRISAHSFFQTRADGADVLCGLVASAADELGAASTAIDLYSGVGLFAGVLAARGWSVTAVERAPSAGADARVNLRDLSVRVLAADVTRWRPPPAELVVADPSRIGLGRRGVDVVAASGAHRVILVSCDAIGLGRDAALLRRRGYALTSLTPVDMFPHTFRVEVVSVFDR
jgi:23S rRNA (uracil1939-C5)-methyltransferase